MNFHKPGASQHPKFNKSESQASHESLPYGGVSGALSKSPAIQKIKDNLQHAKPHESRIKNNIIAFKNPGELYDESLQQMANFNMRSSELINKAYNPKQTANKKLNNILQEVQSSEVIPRKYQSNGAHKQMLPQVKRELFSQLDQDL